MAPSFNKVLKFWAFLKKNMIVFENAVLSADFFDKHKKNGSKQNTVKNTEVES